MDLIFTNSKKVDQGVLTAYAFDLSFGVSENDFEMTLNSEQTALEYGAFAYIEGTEYGGIVDGMGSHTDGDTVTYKGRTWHGVLNSKVIEPDAGANYFTVSGDANIVLASLIVRLGLSELFVAAESLSGINISQYQFKRYCKAYDGIRDMLSSVGAKLKMAWKDRAVWLSAVPISDYTDSPVDGDIATLTVERHEKKVNHLICLGKGELAEREIIHLYIDQFGRIGTTQYYTGLDENMDVYDNNGAESSEELRKGGIERFNELRNTDTAEISATATDERIYDIGDIVGAADIKSGITTAAAVSQKIVKISNGTVTIEYKTGG